ncbi:DUF945 family protein [Gallaecimonas sp. GXIMD4217]|uniref:DUF945 family protein n=1 Tax=Gallaecimonas sp. GXIMD4217 TaxID=3131927 RepID=UPI00311B11AE
MKKTLISLAILACGAAGTTYYAGMEAEKQYQDLVGSLNQQKGIKARSMKFERQFLAGQAQTRVEFTDEGTLALLKELGMPASYVLDHQFKHLPWQVDVHTTLRMTKELAKFKAGFGAVEEPVLLDSTTNLLGQTSFEGRMAMANWSADNGGKTRFYPLSFTGTFQHRDGQLAMNASWNGLEMKAADSRLVMSGIKLDEQRRFTDLGLGVGRSSLTLGALTVNNADGFVGLSAVSMVKDDDVSANGKYRQHSVLQADELKINNDRFKALKLDMTLADFDARALTKVQKLSNNLLADEGNQVAADAFLEALLALLAKGGELQVDNLSMSASTGELKGQGNIRLKAGELKGIESLMGLLNGQFDLQLPKQLGSLEPVDQETLAVLVERGWVREQGSRISMSFRIDDKELSVNGQPLASLL